MELIKQGNIRDRAKYYAELIRNEKVRTNDEFLNDFDDLVDACLFLAVKYQDSIRRKTLHGSEWTAKTINKVAEMKSDLQRVRGV